MAFVTAFNETFADLSRWVVLSAKNGSSNGFPGGPAQFGTDEIETVGDDPENLSFSAGNLRITPTLRADGWHSARIETQRTFKPAQGSVMRIEASIQLPNVHGAQAAGYWPAFWTMGSWQRDDRWIWPACMEYDIGETVNGVNRNWSTVHGGPRSAWGGPFNEPEGYSNQGIAPTSGDLWGGFHVYAFEWDRTTATDTMRWYVDGVQTWTAQPSVISPGDWANQTTQPGVFIILNVAMGGQFPAKMGGGPNTGTLPGVPLICQYVRVSYNGSEAPEAAQGNNGVGGVGTVPPPPVIPPVLPPAPSTSTRTPISTAAPVYSAGASYYTPDSTKTTLTAPLPTNSWFMNFMLGTGHEAVNMFPYDVKVTAQGLDICVPVLNTSSPTSVLATMLQNFSFRATTVSTTQKLTSFTDLSATVQWSNGLSATIVRGMAYVTMNYAAATPVITTQNAIIQVNGTAVGATGTFTGTKFKLALNNGQTWLLYSSASVTLTLSTANTLTAAAALTGTMRLALLPTATDEAVLDSSAACIPTGGTVEFTVSGNTATETYTFTTTGSGTLLMYTMLHHQTWWTFPSAYASPSIATLRGQMRSALGPTWTLSIPLPTVSWDNAAPIRSDRLAAVTSALATDKSFVPVVSDPYFGGKQLAKAARLALIAAQLGDTTSRDLLLGNLKTTINAYLQGTTLRYDTVWGGIVSTAGLSNQDADFGNGRYNDHHFHYGYAIYAAAVIARYDSSWLTANQQRVNDLVRDIMNPSTADPYFTQFRHFDLFEGHSWAAGNFEFGDNRNQESTSEAVNAWYGVYLWGLITNQTQIRDTARLLFAQEVYTAQKYWQIKQADTIYPAPFKQNGVVGIVWSNKVDYATFFGAQAEYIHGIQMLPITPASEVLLPKDWIAEDWANVLSGLWTRTSVWRAEMVSGGSGYTPAQVSSSGQGFTNGLAASGQLQWKSGAGMPAVGGVNRVASGAFNAWRGGIGKSSIAMAWQDVTYSTAATGSAHLSAGGTYAAWTGDMDLTIGGIWSTANGGFATASDNTWAAAATGTWDARWTTILNNLKTRWGSRTSTLYIRFCHELNAGWYDWRVRTTEVADFITAWRRFRGLQQSIFPAAKLVFNTIAEKNGNEYNWTTLWPGDSYVDVYSTDYYGDVYKHVYVDGGGVNDSLGGPRTLEGHRAFAAAHNVPFGVSEWGLDPVFGTGDDVNFIQYVYDFFTANVGTTAGKALYEGYFNETKSETDRRAIYVVSTEPTAKLADPGRTVTEFPLAAARYQSLFARVGQPPTGTGLVFNVNITGGQIVAPFIVFNQHGTGYTEGDIITLNGSGGTGATIRVHTQPEDGWKAVLLGGWSQVNPDDAWTKTLALTGFDDGSSKTQALTHIATQSATATNSLTGTAASTSTTTGNLSLLSSGKNLQGSAASTSTTTGAIALTRSFQGSAVSRSLTTGNIFLARPNALQGFAASTSRTTGSGLQIASFTLQGTARSVSLATALFVLEPNLPGPDVPPDTFPPPLQPGVEPHQFLVGLIQSGLGHYKLSPEQIAEIYYRHLQGERFADMAVEFGLPQSVMRKIISRLRLTDYST